MKVAYVTSHPDNRGGRERFVLETATRIMKLGHDVKLFCNSLDPSVAYPRMLTIPHEIRPARRTLFGYFTAYFGLRAVKKIIDSAIRWNPDIIFLQMGHVFADYLQRTTNISIVPFVHYPETFEPYKKSFIRDVYRSSLRIGESEMISFRNVPLVLCNSYNTERMIHKLEPTARTRVVYPGIDHEKFKPTWKDENYLYYHSRFQKMKNQLLAIRACGLKYNLVLSGFTTKEVPEHFQYYLEVRNEALKYGHKVLTNVTDEQLVQLLQNCSVFLFPSVKEHFGLAPIEAMACGKPVIGHDSGGTTETVGKIGILCGDEVKGWEDTIRYLMENEDVRKRMGKEAYKFSKQFAWENTVGQILQSFEDTLQNVTSKC